MRTTAWGRRGVAELVLVALAVLVVVLGACTSHTGERMTRADALRTAIALGAADARLKSVLTQFPTSSQHTPEALARIAKSYLALGAASEAQTAVAVLDRKFPGSPWSGYAHTALESAALAPFEDERSWISKAFR